MNISKEVEDMLSGFKALDLTDEKGFLCGKILAELGADVVKVERPGGDPSRKLGPFYHDIIESEKSLYWFAYNSSKRGITLNIEAERGRQLFKKLASQADFVIESFRPGYMDRLGLGYGELSRINPKIIVTSITPFGQVGPYKYYKASDISIMAMSGLMSITGDSDRPPLRFGLDQSYCVAGTQAAIGTLFALYHREMSGEGQHVDVSMYDCLVLANYREPLKWEYEKRVTGRHGNRLPRGIASTNQIWQCEDGYVTWTLIDNLGMLRSLVQCMDEEGMAGILKFVDWETVHLSRLSEQEIKPWEELIAAFFLKHTKKELEQLSLERNLTLSVVNDLDDVVENEHLAYRGYWHDLEYPELGTTITSPGFLFLSSETQSRVRFRAPLIGEHNEQIYEKELGLSKRQIVDLKKVNAI
jgi:crotonobetainyl-CoA:carnitine CoA-transferase CaiB-like acyl-CoA transferase